MNAVHIIESLFKALIASCKKYNVPIVVRGMNCLGTISGVYVDRSPLISPGHRRLLSGHRDRKSLEIYQGLSLADLSDEYQKAMNDFPVK